MRSVIGPGVGVDETLSGVAGIVVVGEAVGVADSAGKPGKATPLQALIPRQKHNTRMNRNDLDETFFTCVNCRYGLHFTQDRAWSLIFMLQVYPNSTGWLTRAWIKWTADCTSV